MKKDNNSRKNSELTSKRAKSRGPVQRDTKEVLAELVEKLKEKLDPKKVAATSAGEKHPSGKLRPNLDRLTVGVIWATKGAITAFWDWREKRVSANLRVSHSGRF